MYIYTYVPMLLRRLGIECLVCIHGIVHIHMHIHVYIRPGIECLMAEAQSRQNSVLGPFARTALRRRDGSYSYSFDELLGDINNRQGYFMLLPRVMLLRRGHLELYASLPSNLHEYIDKEPPHSNDLMT